MKIETFIQEFISRKGFSVFLSSIIEKIGGLLLVLIATHFISKEEFGFITYANTSLVFIIPFIGFGMHQGLVRFGSLSASQSKKRYLFNIVIRKGFKYSLILTFGVFFLSSFITYNLKESRIYLIILSIQLVSLFFYEVLRIYARLMNLNNLFARITIVNTVVIVVASFLLSFNFEGIGYAISLAFSTLFLTVFYIVKLNLINRGDLAFDEEFNLKEFLSYGLLTSLSGALSQFLYAVDILLIGNLLKNESMVAQYKVANILPFSFLFLALVFMKTSFVKIANKSTTDRNYIKDYYINYLKIFSLISLLIIVVFYFFSDTLLLLFGSSYSNDSDLMQIFSLGVVGALLFRIPLGNILSAIGWPKINALNAFVILILNVVFSYIFINKYGVIGAAFVTAFLMWFSGALSLIAFIKYLREK